MRKHIYPLNQFADAIQKAKEALKQHLPDGELMCRFYILPYRFGTYMSKIASLPSSWKVEGWKTHPCEDEKYKDHPDASNLCTGNLVLQVQLAVQGPHVCIVITIIDVKTDNYTTMSCTYAVDYTSSSDQTNLCKEVYWDIQELGVMDEVMESLATSLGNNENYYVKP